MNATMSNLFAYEASQLPLPGASGTSESDVREVGNYVKALEFGITRLKKLPLSLRLIREVFKQLLTGVRGGHATPGEFRETPNWIGGRNLNDAVYVPPPVGEMQTALHELEIFLHSDDSFPPLIRLALIHAQFERIHPFIDGNVRIGRLLIILTLLSWTHLLLPLLYLSAYFERRPRRVLRSPAFESAKQEIGSNGRSSFSTASLSRRAMRLPAPSDYRIYSKSGGRR